MRFTHERNILSYFVANKNKHAHPESMISYGLSCHIKRRHSELSPSKNKNEVIVSYYFETQ